MLNTQFKSVERSLDLKKQVQCLAVSSVAKLLAVGCQTELKLLKIETNGTFVDFGVLNNPPNAFITDITWAPKESGKFAFSLSCGSISTVSVNNRVGKQLKQDWASGRVSSCVNRIAWHPVETNIIASANQDGPVKIFDVRLSGNAIVQQCKIYGNRNSSGTRDVKFDPFHPDIFAEVSDNGSLKVWDRRYLDKAMMCKINAHSQPVTSIAWNPCTEWILATGSKDKTVKIWDLNSCSVSEGTSAAVSVNGKLDASTHDIEPVHIKSVHTSSAVGRVYWRGVENCYRNQIMTAAAYVAPTVTPDNGNICFWDLDSPNIPICVLKGHTEDAVTDFDWLEGVFTGMSDSQKSLSGKSKKQISRAKSQKMASTSSSNDELSMLLGGRGAERNVHLQISNLIPETASSSSRKYLVSCGRDGKVLIQNPQLGFFPYDHMSSTLTSISSQGHVAYHRGALPVDMRSDPAGNPPTRVRAASAAAVSAHHSPSTVGSILDTLSSLTTGMSPVVAEGKIGPQIHSTAFNNSTVGSGKLPVAEPIALKTGSVFIGMAEFSNLEEAKGIHSRRSAEGGIFDPALISLLATNYSMAHDLNHWADYDVPHDASSFSTGSHDNAGAMSKSRANSEEDLMRAAHKRQRDLQKGHRACVHNLHVAQAAGLTSRTCLWSTLLTLLPQVPPGNPVDSSSIRPAIAATQASEQSSHSVISDFSFPFAALEKPSNGIEALQQSFPNELPFANEIVAKLLDELLEGGDSQHFVVVCEILRKYAMLDAICKQANIPDFRIRKAYLAYIDLLTKLQLFSEANTIIKVSTDPVISQLSRQGVEIHIRCAQCKKEITEHSSTAWCVRCVRCVSMCVMCNRPVRGLLHWCPVCGHGGHIECTRAWFRQSNTCPSGCGHDCCSSFCFPTSKAHKGTELDDTKHTKTSVNSGSDSLMSEAVTVWRRSVARN